MALKQAPERWQLNTCAAAARARGGFGGGAHAHARSQNALENSKQFDVVVAFEERVFDQILEGAPSQRARWPPLPSRSQRPTAPAPSLLRQTCACAAATASARCLC